MIPEDGSAGSPQSRKPRASGDDPASLPLSGAVEG